MGALQHHRRVHLEQRAQAQCIATVAHPDAVQARVHHPGVLFRVEGRQLLLRDLEGQGLGFAGGEPPGLGKAGQPPPFPRQFPLRGAEVDLRNLPPGKAGASVGHLHLHGQVARLDIQPGGAQRKGRVGQPEPEGEQRPDAETVKVAVAHIDPVAVGVLADIAVQAAERAGAGDVVVPAGPGGGQLALRHSAAQQHIGHGLPALLPELGKLQNGVEMLHAVQQAGEFHRAAGVEEQDHRQAAFVQRLQVGPLGVAEVVVAGFQPAVLSLAGDAADDVEGRFGPFEVLRPDGAALGQGKGAGRVGVKRVVHLFGGGQHLRPPVFPRAGIAGLAVGQPVLARQRDAGLFEALPDRDAGPVVHIAGTGAALDRPPGPGAEQRHRRAGVQRQHTAVFQQNDPRGGRLAGQGGVLLFPWARGRVAGAAVRKWLFHNKTPYLSIKGETQQNRHRLARYGGLPPGPAPGRNTVSFIRFTL